MNEDGNPPRHSLLPGPTSEPILSSRRHMSGSRPASYNRISLADSLQFDHPPPALHMSTEGSNRFASFLKEIKEDDARVVYVDDPDGLNHFATNSIRTGKYTVLSFLPRNLYEQFRRVAYVYFLVIAVLNQIPMFAVFTRAASVFPLSFVLLVTAVKDGIEDWRRHRSDKIENSRTATVLVDGEFRPKLWKDVRVGEVVKVNSDETLPCDIVLLSTSDPTGVAYVQTVNLDGESNLKTRYAKQETMEGYDGVVIRCERPNRNIYGFLANLEVDGKRSSLGPSNILLRGCELRNTNWAIGVAVYTGSETKVMLNSSGASSKRSRLEKRMNREIIFLSVILFFMCALVAVLHGVWLLDHKDELDVIPFYRKKEYSNSTTVKDYKYYGIGLEIVFAFFMSIIVFQIMIPIFLYIAMEVVRLGQAYFMTRDRSMYDEVSDSKFQCRALNINEDLGQVKYVFSDKTGTLTENKMEFQSASIGGVDYSGGDAVTSNDGRGSCSVSVDGQVWRPKMMVGTDPKLVEVLRSGIDTEQRKHAQEFFLALATCNTIVPLAVETSDPAVKLIDYQGESPDEQALVYAAAAFGFVLLERTSGHIIIDVLGKRQRFDILGLHEFDSDRKRMSVIVGCPDKKIKLFVKGADSSMLGILASISSDMMATTEAHLNTYSSLGLRTLVVGMKELSNAEYEEWHSSYERASTALLGRGNLLRALAIDTEHSLHLLGVSAIEDKLQQGVPEAIESLRTAGMKVWVLTGDKQETAISIGYSCKLLTSEMPQIIINSHTEESCKQSLHAARNTIMEFQNSTSETESAKAQLALIIDGKSLLYVLDKNSDLEEELFNVAISCDVVLCCRVAPLQKAGIVALIKKRTNDMTLAIGDGANDVSMIQMADVGIGISGREGRQAVMASDFTMGQFRFLVPLLLVHGHWNYQRMAYMILYNFYRNSVFIFLLFWYVLYTAYTAANAVTDWSSVLYSVIYTSLPTVVVGILEKNLSRKTLLKYTHLYGAGQREEKYNLKLFLLTMMDSVWQSCAVFFVPYLAYRGSDVDVSSIGDVFTLGIVFVVNIHLAMDVYRWNWITHASIWGSTVATVIAVFIIDSLPYLPGYWAIFHTTGTGTFWFIILGIIVIAMVPRFVIKAATEYFWPGDAQIAREFEHFWNPNEVEINTITNPSQGGKEHTR